MTETGEKTVRNVSDDPEGNLDIEDNYLDPRIQKEIDKLNLCGAETNRLENELDEARTKYRSIISESSTRMESMAHAQKKSIQRAREYYKLKEEAKISQAEALKAARQFQSANGIYNAAKETVALAECRLIENADAAAAQLTTAWQDMLNHAISKVTASEKEKSRNEQEHKRRASRYAELEGRILVLEQKYKSAIKNARPYFDMKADLDLKLIQQKQNVNDLQATIRGNKIKYTDALRKLEQISDEIHQARHTHKLVWSMFPRMPGVGAEKGSPASSTVDLEYDPADLLYDSGTEDDIDTDSLSLENIDTIMANDIQNLDTTASSKCEKMNPDVLETSDNKQCTISQTNQTIASESGNSVDIGIVKDEVDDSNAHARDKTGETDNCRRVSDIDNCRRGSDIDNCRRVSDIDNCRRVSDIDNCRRGSDIENCRRGSDIDNCRSVSDIDNCRRGSDIDNCRRGSDIDNCDIQSTDSCVIINITSPCVNGATTGEKPNKIENANVSNSGITNERRASQRDIPTENHVESIELSNAIVDTSQAECAINTCDNEDVNSIPDVRISEDSNEITDAVEDHNADMRSVERPAILGAEEEGT